MRLLIADDEMNLAMALKSILQDAGYECDICNDGESVLEKVYEDVYDGLILDIMMPKTNGYEVLVKIRQQKIDIPVLLLSALNDVDDKVTGLDLGANDYMAKPFSSKELLARVRVMLKQNTIDDSYLQYEDILLNKKDETLSCKDIQYQLSKYEYALLSFLIKSENHPVPLWRVLEKIWNNAVDVDEKTVELYVSYLNRKLKSLQSNVYIKLSEENVQLCGKIEKKKKGCE